MGSQAADIDAEVAITDGGSCPKTWVVPERDRTNRVTSVHAFARGIAPQRGAQESFRGRRKRLLRVKRRESVGRLAVGVARDINILAPNFGFTEDGGDLERIRSTGHRFTQQSHAIADLASAIVGTVREEGAV